MFINNKGIDIFLLFTLLSVLTWLGIVPQYQLHSDSQWADVIEIIKKVIQKKF